METWGWVPYAHPLLSSMSSFKGKFECFIHWQEFLDPKFTSLSCGGVILASVENEISIVAFSAINLRCSFLRNLEQTWNIFYTFLGQLWITLKQGIHDWCTYWCSPKKVQTRTNSCIRIKDQDSRSQINVTLGEWRSILRKKI